MFTVAEFVDRSQQLKRMLYHFTDARNIEGIRQHGLLPTSVLKATSLPMVTGGDLTSLSIDAHKGLDSLISLSFCVSHPMSHVAQEEGRIDQLRILQVCPTVLLRDGTLVANQVATANDAVIERPDVMLPQLDFVAAYERLDWRTRKDKPGVQRLKSGKH